MLSGDRADFETLEFSSSADNDTGKNVTNFIFISRKIANNAWKLNNKLIFGASFIYPDGRIFCNKLSKIKTYSIKEGFCETLFEPKLNKKENQTDKF